jgi:hypothetical protein
MEQPRSWLRPTLFAGFTLYGAVALSYGIAFWLWSVDHRNWFYPFPATVLCVTGLAAWWVIWRAIRTSSARGAK